ncbi:MAG: VanZ family protein [Ginsengibacter sp.]
MGKISFKKFLPAIAWFFIILILCCLPGSDIPEIGWLASIHFDKLVHLGLFAILVFLFGFPFFGYKLSTSKRIRYVLWIMILASLFGLSIEFIQKYFVTGRTFDLLDWAADSLGAIIAFFYCRYRIEKSTRVIRT